MMATNRVREAEEAKFSRRAAGVIHSPYFYVTPSFPTMKEAIAHDKKRFKEYRRLQSALENADVYADLPPDARAIFDKAEKAIKDYNNDEVALDRMGDIPNLYVNDAAVLQNRNPDPETAAILIMAITQAMAKGDRKTADYLASLAKTPEKIYELIDGESVTIEGLQELAKKAPQVKPSPFRRR